MQLLRGFVSSFQREAGASQTFLVMALCCLGANCPAQDVRRAALSPQDSQQQLVLEPGFKASLLAHEPHVMDPVEVAFDDAGRMWVVEMRDYPFRTAEEPGGRIRVLTDQDSDGLFESSQVFADHLEMPTGIALWKDGAVVTVAGRLIYLQDQDGDLKADSSQVWLEGFTEDNEQLRANHPRLGPDGKWYIASGLRGGDVRLGKDLASGEQTPLHIGSRDVRYDPAHGTLELITGPAQFGLCFDPLGNRLFCSNRNPAVQVVFEQEDLAGNPLAGLAPSVVDVLPAGEKSKVFPLVDAWTTSHLHSGQFTAACGVFVRVDPAIAREEQGTGFIAEVFACEPTGSLVKRERAASGDYQLARLEPPSAADHEWLASRDPWFRPVNVTLAPDGELVIVDMHRAVIEHPRFVPEELKNRPDERWGSDSGRIYWIGRTGNLSETLAELRSTPLASRSNAELTQLVASENPWMRQTASRLLFQRAASETAVIDPLLQQAHDTSLASPGRIDSLRLAANLLDDVPPRTDELFTASDRAIAVVALRIVRDYPRRQPEPTDALLSLISGDSKQLQFESWLCLGRLASNSETSRWDLSESRMAELLASYVEPWPLIAVGSAFREQPEFLLRAWLQSFNQVASQANRQRSFVPAATRALTDACLRSGAPSNTVIELAKQLLESATVADARLAALACLDQFARSQPRGAALDTAFWSRIAALATSDAGGLEVQAQAIALLGRSNREADVELLRQMVQENTNPDLAVPLLEAWANMGDAACDTYLVDHLAAASPGVARSILRLLAERPERLALLAESLVAGQLVPRQIGAADLKKLAARAKGETQQTLESYLSQITNSNRAQVAKDYQACLSLSGDPTRGIELFRKHCAACHRVGDIGVQVGPDISDSRTKQPIEILNSILDPNLAIDNNYFRFVVLTLDGRVIDGMIAEETEDALTLLGQDNKRERILREDIVELKATGVSLMPEGLESQIDQPSMADLIAFIKGWRYLDGSIPKPQ